MKRKCVVLFILLILICVYLQLFSGCAKKVAVEPGPVQEEIAAQKKSEVEYQRVAQEERKRADHERRVAEEAARRRMETGSRGTAGGSGDAEEFFLEEIVVVLEPFNGGGTCMFRRKISFIYCCVLCKLIMNPGRDDNHMRYIF